MAKKFTYRFESILKLREFNTQQAQESLNYAVKIKTDKLELIDKNTKKINRIFDLSDSKLTAFELQTLSHNKSFIEDEIKRINEEIVELNEIIGIRRTKLTTAMKEEKIMNKLKERKFNDYIYDSNKEETSQFDEIAGRRAQISKLVGE